MLTREGWLVAGGAAALIALGRLLGVLELFVVGAAAALLLVGAVLFVSLSRLSLSVSRRLHPPRVHAGDLSRVELRIANSGGRRSPVLRLRDAVTGTRGANLLLGPLGGGGQVRAAYQLPTERRGVITIGPLEVMVSDPFGLAQRVVSTAGTSELTVYPRLHDIGPLPMASGADPQSSSRLPNVMGRSGEDFYTLRSYVVGDDLRKVHWPSTARFDELMVRQTEQPWQGRTTVVLDVRRTSHTPASFELAVSAAASIALVQWRRGDQVRLVTTAGADSGFGSAHEHLDAIMAHLALLALASDASIQRTLGALAHAAAGGALVLVVGAVADSDLQRLTAMQRVYPSLTTVLFEPSATDPKAIDLAAPSAPGRLVRVTGEEAFPEAWARSGGAPFRTGSAAAHRVAPGAYHRAGAPARAAPGANGSTG
ncbi:MAG: DUF58 domain-containing protein [Acidimicrobiales bacterium]